VYVIDAGARTVAALTLHAESADPALSPDGTRIAYAAFSGPTQASALTSTPRRLRLPTASV
jgi:hypothetical protein